MDNEGWSETPDFSAWKVEEEKLFDWSQPLAKIENKYKVSERDKLDSGWGNSFNMVVKNFEKKTLKFFTNEQYQSLKKERHGAKFDIEPPKDNSNAAFVNFHYED